MYAAYASLILNPFCLQYDAAFSLTYRNAPVHEAAKERHAKEKGHVPLLTL